MFLMFCSTTIHIDSISHHAWVLFLITMAISPITEKSQKAASTLLFSSGVQPTTRRCARRICEGRWLAQWDAFVTRQ
jgi:hypothetical protein